MEHMKERDLQDQWTYLSGLGIELSKLKKKVDKMLEDLEKRNFL